MSYQCPTEPRRRSRSWAYVVIPAAAFALGLVVAVGAAKTRDEPFPGVYRQEAIPVVSDRAGTFVAVEIPHGTDVVPGQKLAVLEDASGSGRVAALTAEKASLERELDAARRKASAELAARTGAIEKDRLETRLRYADLLRARLDVQVQRKALEAYPDDGAPTVASRARTAIRQASVDLTATQRRLELADARNHEEVLDAQIALCEDRLAALERSVAELPARLDHAFEIDRLRDDLDAIDAEIAAAASVPGEVAVCSPAHGRVGIYRRANGDPVTTGETVVEVFDAERPYVLVSVGLEDATAFTPGRRVTVAFEGIKSKKPLSGMVAEVRSEAELDADAAVAPGTLTVQIRITPVGRLWPAVPLGTTALVSPSES